MTLRSVVVGLVALVLGCSSETAPASTPDAARADTSAGRDTATDTAAVDAAVCTGIEIKCGDTCVDVTADPANCGMCGKACGRAQTCVGGACSCESPATLCSGACVDTQTDAMNCGTCGKACGAGESCADGKCYPACASGTTRCGGVCIDTQTDGKNCGACGKACATGESCTAGVCGLACDFPTTNCGGKCVNTGFDPNHCGGCGKACPTGSKGTANCTGGSCILTCDTGFGNCDDDPKNGCEVDYSANDSHCGVCGKRCTSAEICTSSRCECRTGTARCSGVCTDLTTSDTNCGTCGRVCPAGESCSSSTCSCKTGFTRCGLTCVDTKADPANCGACGAACGGGGVCSDGKCCPSGELNCGGVCIDPTRSITNCGACGTTCSGSTPYCVAGSCASTCASGSIACSGACTSVDRDPKNCGTCGNTCATTEICSSGSCIAAGFPGSTIVTAAEGNTINGWLGTPSQVWKLCYSKAMHAHSAATFHSLCNGKGPSVTIARLSTGKIIGAYAPVSWTSTAGYKGDATAFLFSITNNFKHTVRLSSYFMYDSSVYGPTFGGGSDWQVSNSMNGGYCSLGYTYNCRVGSSTTCHNDFCGSYGSWTIPALEVWVK